MKFNCFILYLNCNIKKCLPFIQVNNLKSWRLSQGLYQSIHLFIYWSKVFWYFGGTWVAQSVKHQTSLGHDLTVLEFKPHTGWDRVPLWAPRWQCRASLSLSLSLCPSLTCILSLERKKERKKEKKQQKMKTITSVLNMYHMWTLWKVLQSFPKIILCRWL